MPSAPPTPSLPARCGSRLGCAAARQANCSPDLCEDAGPSPPSRLSEALRASRAARESRAADGEEGFSTEQEMSSVP